MAATKISDIIEPSTFAAYFIQESIQNLALFKAGIVTRSALFDKLAGSGGRSVNLPFFDDLTGDDEVLSDSASLTAAAITTGKDIATIFRRGKAWGVNDLAKALSGADPMKAIADQVVRYWDGKNLALLIKILTGVFADNIANDSSDLVSDISIADGVNAVAANKISGTAVLTAAQKLGDAKDRLVGIAMHSLIQAALAAQQLISTVKDKDGNILFQEYLGLRVFVNDSCPVVAGGTSGYVYTSYLFGEGALALGEAGNVENAVETDRDSLAGEDYLVHRRHFILHPRGIAWQTGSVAGSSPTNAEAALAANWNRVYDQKNIRLVALKTNG